MAKSQVKGLEECRRNLKKLEKSFETAGVATLVKWGRGTIDDSKDNYCPTDTGLMKGTGNIATENEGNTHYVVLFYNTDYAPIVHEGRAYHPIGESNFLRTPFNQRAPELISDMKYGLGKVVN